MKRVSWLPMLLAVLGMSAACAPELTGYDVDLVTTSDCTLTGVATRNCQDPATLALTSVHGHWILDRAADGAFTITTEDGNTVAGITFANDGTVLSADGCKSEGGDCYFARRKSSNTDPSNNTCEKFAQFVVIAHFEGDKLVGVTRDLQGTRAIDPTATTCTESAIEVVRSIHGSPTAAAALARSGATP